MKKKIGIALALLLVLAMTLSVTAHATEPSQTIAGSRDGGTAISITDITPREGENKEDSETGDSLRIPPDLLELAGFPGLDDLTYTVENGRIIIEREDY